MVIKLAVTALCFLIIGVNAFGGEAHYVCSAGLDAGHEEPAATFEVQVATKDIPWKEIVLDKENDVRVICWAGVDALTCRIGKYPAGLPENEKNAMNFEAAADAFTWGKAGGLYLATHAFKSFKSDKHTNYVPFVTCEKKAK